MKGARESQARLPRACVSPGASGRWGPCARGSFVPIKPFASFAAGPDGEATSSRASTASKAFSERAGWASSFLRGTFSSAPTGGHQVPAHRDALGRRRRRAAREAESAARILASTSRASSTWPLWTTGRLTSSWSSSRGAAPRPAPLRARPSASPEEAVGYILGRPRASQRRTPRGIVHRDLKPSNFFLAESAGRVVKVLDFGLSKVRPSSGAPEDVALTHSAALLGSPLYMSPEQMMSAKSVDGGEPTSGRSEPRCSSS